MSLLFKLEVLLLLAMLFHFLFSFILNGGGDG